MKPVIGILTSMTALLSAGLSASVCALPFVAISLGVGGLGWLTRYAAWQTPLLLLSVSLLVAAWLGRWRKRGDVPCKRSVVATLFWACATVLMAAVITIEYLIIPNLN